MNKSNKKISHGYYLQYPYIDGREIKKRIKNKKVKYVNILISKIKYQNSFLLSMNYVLESYYEYIQCLKKISSDNDVAWVEEKVIYYNHLIIRKYMHLLSSIYAFMEYNPTVIDHIIGKGLFNKQRELTIGDKYKIIEKIRNYSQHHGIPIDGVRIRRVSTKVEADLSFSVNFKKMERMEAHWNEVCDYIKKYGEPDLLSLSEDYIKDIYKLYCDLVCLLSKNNYDCEMQEFIDESKKILLNVDGISNEERKKIQSLARVKITADSGLIEDLYVSNGLISASKNFIDENNQLALKCNLLIDSTIPS